MELLRVILQIIYVLDCIALAVVVLRQEGKVAGLSGALVGTGETYWSKNRGRSAEGTLEKATKYMAAAFIIISILLNLNIWPEL
jgi:preprotein translocase subunit SecG